MSSLDRGFIGISFFKRHKDRIRFVYILRTLVVYDMIPNKKLESAMNFSAIANEGSKKWQQKSV